MDTGDWIALFGVLLSTALGVLGIVLALRAGKKAENASQVANRISEDALKLEEGQLSRRYTVRVFSQDKPTTVLSTGEKKPKRFLAVAVINDGEIPIVIRSIVLEVKMDKHSADRVDLLHPFRAMREPIQHGKNTGAKGQIQGEGCALNLDEVVVSDLTIEFAHRATIVIEAEKVRSIMRDGGELACSYDDAPPRVGTK